MGRKIYLLAGSDAGGERAALAYSLIETAKLNVLNLYDYLAYIIERIADHPINRIDELLPWHGMLLSNRKCFDNRGNSTPGRRPDEAAQH